MTVNNMIDEAKTIHVLLELYDIIQKAKDEERKKVPYRFNALLQANPLEPGISGILAGFFQQTTKGEFRILKSFVKRFWGDSLATMISSPTIKTEEPVIDDCRIDILIYEKDKYAIILENKIWDAVDQPNQLANYIDSMKSIGYGFSDEQIYVGFLPRTKNHNPSLNSWISKETGESYKEAFKGRYKLIDFTEKILPWLISSKAVQTICDDEYFEPSRFLFIDYLRRKLELDSIDNMIQKEIENKLKEHLYTDDPIADADKLLQMINDLPKVDIKEVVRLLKELRKEKTVMAMQEWVDRLHRDYNESSIFDDRNGSHMSIGVNVPYNGIPEFFSVFIWNFHNSDRLSVGIALTKEGTPHRKEIEPKVWELLRGKKGFQKGVEWLYYKNVSYEQAYPLLQELVRDLPNI